MHKENSGFAILNGDAAHLPEKTVIVLGAARGGTSMVAGTLSKLGLYMGEDLPTLYEDSVMSLCLRQNDKRQAKKIIKERNEKYAVWGFKKPSLRLWSWLSLFREPVYIIVFRDLFATANRRVVSLDKFLFREMLNVLGVNLCLLLFLRFSKRPILIASYEKALLAPDKFVGGLTRFLGIIDKPSAVSDAVTFISPSPAAYTMRSTTRSRLDADGQWFGYIDIAETDIIAGWALSTTDHNAVEIELLINGSRAQTILANLPRPDVQLSNSRFHRNCGFVFEFPEQRRLNNGDQIEVRIAGPQLPLINSPLKINAGR